MAFNVNLQGQVVNRLLASAGVLALVGPLGVMGGLIPEEARVPWLAVIDRSERATWHSVTSRIEVHTVEITAYAPAADPPTLLTDPPRQTPAEAIMDAAEQAIDWQELFAEGVPGVNALIRVERRDRTRQTEKARGVRVRRVQRAEATWEIEVGVDV